MKNNMIYVVYNDVNGITQTGYIYENIRDYINDTWNPTDRARVAYKMGFNIKGKTYQEKKAAFEGIIHDFQAHDVGGLSYYELMLLDNWLETNARRYGLVTELKENGII